MTIPFLSEAFVARLGWTLLHFLWQGFIVAIVYAAARAVLRPSRPESRYALACFALAAMALAPVITYWRLQPVPTDAVQSQASPSPSATAQIPATAPISLPSAALSNAPQFLPAVVLLWFCGVAVFSVRLIGGWLIAARLRSSSVAIAGDEWQAALQRLGVQIRLSRPVRLLASARVNAPMVVGWLRPVVLFPAAALAGVPSSEMEALLLHELAHIRRADYAINLLQSALEALLFYHPAVWWISGQVRAEREMCCDDVAVSITGDVLTYARALASAEAARAGYAQAALAATGGSLTHRIARLLGRPPLSRCHGLNPGKPAVAVLLLALASALVAQLADRPAFQVASVKPNTSLVPRHIVRALPGGRLTAENAPLMMLIQNAYSVQWYQVVGGPKWINTEGFDIDAKPDAPVDRKQVWPMLQTLLADRFKLTFHRESRELPVYALAPAKSGIKVQPSTATSCPEDPPSPAAPQVPCGLIRVGGGPAGIHFEGNRVPMSELVRILAGVLGRPVIDRTGYSQPFDVRLDFAPDASTAGLPRPPGPAPGNDTAGPIPITETGGLSIFTAVQEQLGLKLDSTKGPVEVMAIDHVEKPSPN